MNNIFEKSMVKTGLFITDTVIVTLLALVSFLKKGLKLAARLTAPLKEDLAWQCRELLKKGVIKLEKLLKSAESSKKKFAERKHAYGLLRALLLGLGDIIKSDRKHKKIFKAVINHIAPVAAVFALMTVVSDTVAVSYGITVEYNGLELGTVSEESVIGEAQRILAERATYYDIGEAFNAGFSIRPLGAADETICEKTLASIIEEQLPDIIPAELETEVNTGRAAETAEAAGAAEAAEDRVRAFAVTVDGEPIGWVSDFERIEQFLEELEERYATEDILSARLEKEIEYIYEQYVSPQEIVSEQDILDIFNSIESEPVYYEVQAGDSPWSLARANGMTDSEFRQCVITFNGRQIDIDKEFPIGAMIQLSAEVPFLQVLVEKEMTYNRKIKFDTEYIDDPELFKGDTRVVTEGVEGMKRIQAEVTFKNEKAVSQVILEEEIISEPVTKVIRRGTRENRTPISTGSGGSGTYFWPVGNGSGTVTSNFLDRRGRHKGIDIAAPRGTPIYAAATGNVTLAGWKSGGYGNAVVVSGDDGYVTVYAHMSSVAISRGERVVKGQLIGYVGSTGDSTGNHLHFEVRSGGRYLNPADFIKR